MAGWQYTNLIGETAFVGWADMVKNSIATKDGIINTTDGGVTVSFGFSYDSVDSYAVQFWVQGDPGTGTGDIYPVKSLSSCVIKNSGSTFGVKVYYRITPVIGL